MDAKPIVYSCSGCSDAGEISDRAARQLAREGVVEMSCLAGIGGRVKPLMQKCTQAPRILVIDGCPLACARHTLEAAGFARFERLNLADLGIRKGSVAVTAEIVDRVVAQARRVLNGEATSED